MTWYRPTTTGKAVHYYVPGTAYFVFSTHIVLDRNICVSSYCLISRHVICGAVQIGTVTLGWGIWSIWRGCGSCQQTLT